MASRLPPRPGDEAARGDALRVIGGRLLRWGVPLLAVSVLCILLGLPWWLVGGGIAFFAVVILFDT